MSEIKNHPFFSSIDWARLSNLGIKPPVRPEIDEDEDSDDELDIINKVIEN